MDEIKVTDNIVQGMQNTVLPWFGKRKYVHATANFKICNFCHRISSQFLYMLPFTIGITHTTNDESLPQPDKKIGAKDLMPII